MMPKRTVICDIETDGLLPDVSVIHCIVCKDWDTGEVLSWTPDTIQDFVSFTDTVGHWIGHNFIGYDMRVLRKLLGIRIRPACVTDTLLVSRLQQYTRIGGHSLKSWGETLQFPKLPYKDFSDYSKDMLEYCINDVELTYKVEPKPVRVRSRRRKSTQTSRPSHKQSKQTGEAYTKSSSTSTQTDTDSDA